MVMRLFKVLWIALHITIGAVGYGLIVYYKIWDKTDLAIALVCMGPLITMVMGAFTTGITSIISWIITGDKDALNTMRLWIIPWEIEERMQEKKRKLIEDQKEVDNILRKEGLPY